MAPVTVPMFTADVIDKAAAPKSRRLYRVIDAETLRPVEGATVSVSKPFNILGPHTVSGQTDRDGYVRLDPARPVELADVNAPGRVDSGHGPIVATDPLHASIAGPRGGEHGGAIVLTT